MSFDAGALVFQIKTAGYKTTEQELDALDRKVSGVGKTAEEAAPKVEKTGKATDELGKKAKAAKAPLDEQAKSTKQTGDESETAEKKQKKQKDTTEQQAEAAKKLGAALTIAGVAVAAMVTLSVAKFVEFDQAMSNTAAATMASIEDKQKLSEAALKAGADTAYSASEAAAAEEELAKAGISVADIVGGSLNGALGLAAAGQLQVARSAEIMATTLTQFGLTADKSGHVADILAAGAGKAQGSVDDLALALSYVGPVSAGLKISLEETGGALAYMASQGIIGERAGTSLRGVLMSLTSPSATAAETMNDYGIEIFDAQGNMKDLATISEILRQRLGGLTEAERSAALGRIFGNEQITAARVLYSGGAKAINEWTAAVNDSGYAAEQAAMRQDNLAGDIEKLGGAMDTALIKTGSGANTVLRDMVQNVTALVDWYGELPDPVQQFTLVLGVGTAALLLAAGAALVLRTRMLEMKAQMDAAGVSMGRTAALGGVVGLALTGVITVVALLAQAQADAKARAEAYADAIEAGGDAAEKFIAKQLAMKDSFLWMDRGSAIDNAKKLGISIDEVTQAVKGSATEFDTFKERVQAAYETKGQGVEFGISMQQLIEKVAQLRTAQADAATATRNTKDAQELLTGSTDRNAASVGDAADAYLNASKNVEDLDKKLHDLVDTVNAANKVGQDAVTSNLSYQDSLAKIDETIKKAADGVEGYSATLDESTQAGRDNKGMLVDLADKAQAAADAQFNLDGNTDNYRATLEAGRQTLIDRAQQLGYNADQAQALADQIYRIPSETEWKIIADTNPVRQQIDQFIADASAKVVRIGVTTYSKDGPDGQIRISTPGAPSSFANGGVVTYHASGSVSENHVAQIARAGEWRVWAEPETGGESYIPHAAAKRARADQIMMQTASILGGTYIPGGASTFAEGGATTTATPGLVGLAISGTLDLGNGLIGIIDGRISDAQYRGSVRASAGRSTK